MNRLREETFCRKCGRATRQFKVNAPAGWSINPAWEKASHQERNGRFYELCICPDETKEAQQ